MLALVDQRDREVPVPHRPHGEEPGKAAAHDHDAMPRLAVHPPEPPNRVD